jgi:hypothetical protein
MSEDAKFYEKNFSLIMNENYTIAIIWMNKIS